MYLSVNTAAPFAQLRGMGCGSCNRGLGALGDMNSLIEQANQFNPEPISHAALNFITKVQNFLGIGRGRMEADQIVPTQNQVVTSVIAPIAEAVNAEYRTFLSQEQLQQMLNALLNAKDAWLAFLHNTTWADGRAATQAEATLRPYWDDQQSKIIALMADAPSQNYSPTTGGPGGVVPIIAGVPTLGLPPVRITTTGGASSFTSLLTQYAPMLLLGAAVFALPKIGKWQPRAKPNRSRRYKRRKR